MKMTYVRPAPGLKIRMPERGHQHLPEAGAEVPLDPYWRRLIADGDVVQGKPEKKPKS